MLHYAAVGGFTALVERILSQNVDLNKLLFTKDTVSVIAGIKSGQID